ncbi:hypothetical protein HID58_083542 [Brassica napus]|uniref:Uncharacterized protein n=1 Tax=Brassica napus TaxID=3708 RepID=A0ABQ7YDK9_BRANA|nr:hypothetical protein HID58_083542 [Brassica napus]
MDLETENRIALVLLREAAELRRQAEKDGIDLTRGFSQQLSLVFNNKTKGSKENQEESSSSSSQMKRSSSFSKRSLDKRCSSINEERNITHQSSSDKRLYLDDDDEIESFLRSLNKRGRGSVGPRMDETVPYLPTEKVDQLQKWGVLEKSPEAALNVDQTIFVAVAEDVERSKTMVLWAARNFSSKKICLLYVHRPARPASCSENLLLLFLSDLTVLW